MLDRPTEITINATAFKARCLDLMDQLNENGLAQVTITKRGKIVAIMKAPPTTAKRSIIGCLKDRYPLAAAHDWTEDDFKIDWSQHMLSDEELDAKFERQMKDAS